MLHSQRALQTAEKTKMQTLDYRNKVHVYLQIQTVHLYMLLYTL